MMKKLFSSAIFLLFGGIISANTGIINIQGTDFVVDTIQHSKVGPGTVYTKLKIVDKSYPLDIHMLKVDLNNPYIKCETLLAKDSIITGEKPSELAQRKSSDKKLYFAGTNADGFRSAPNGKAGYPYTTMVIRGEIATRPIDRAVVAFDLAKNPYLGSVDFKCNVAINGKTVVINDINADWSTEDLVFFNQLNGKSTHMGTDRNEVLIELLPTEKWLVNKKMAFKVVNISDKGNTPISAGQAVLSGIGEAKIFLNTLKAGDIGEIDISLPFKEMEKSPVIDELSGGDRIILTNGEIWDNDWAERHPRTGFGYSADKKTIYYCIVDGRITQSVGVTTKQLVDIMKSAGANSAINFDGGGSSSMYIRGLGQVNNPSDGVERDVPSGMFISTEAPQDKDIAEISTIVPEIKIPKYCIYKPTIYGYNKYGILVSTDVKDVELSCPDGFGIIKDKNTFVAMGEGEQMISCTYNGKTISVPVTIEPLTEVTMRNNSIVNDTYLDYQMELDATLNGKKIPIASSVASWSVDDSSVLEINHANGSLRGIKNGTTNVNGSIGDFVGSMKVVVEKPTARVMAVDPNIDLSTWKITQVGGKNIAATPLDNGIKLTYIGASGRGPNIKLSKNVKVWSLPDSIRIRINPAGSPINKITLTVIDNNGTVVNGVKERINLNEDNTINFTVSELFGNDEIGKFPLTINNITMSMGTSDTGKEYSILIPGIEAVYKAVPAESGVEQIKKDEELINLYPNPAQKGDIVKLETEGSEKATIIISSLTGQDVLKLNADPINKQISISTELLQQGIYTVTLIQNGSTKSSKLIIN